MVGPGTRRAVDESGFRVLVSAHQTMVRPCRLVDALIAIPEIKIYDHGSNFAMCEIHCPRTVLKRLSTATKDGSPVSFRNDCEGRLEAVSVVAFVTTVAEKQSIFVVSVVAKLAGGFHDGLVPGDARLEDVEGHSQLRSIARHFHCISPGLKTTGYTS